MHHPEGDWLRNIKITKHSEIERESLGNAPGDPRQRNGKKRMEGAGNEESEKRSVVNDWSRVKRVCDFRTAQWVHKTATLSRTQSSKSGKSRPVHTRGIDSNPTRVTQAPSATPMPPLHRQSRANPTTAYGKGETGWSRK